MGVAQVPLMTRALQVTTPGGPQVLEVRDVELRAPGPDEVLVRVEASGVNFIDVYQREGIYPQPTPFTLGVEGAGVEIATGRRVAWCMSNGAHAEHAVVPSQGLVPVPEDVTFEQAAAALLQGMTAHYLINSVYDVKSGDVVLVHAAAGGVGQWLVQWCASRGASVIATAGTEAKVAKALALGAAHALNYSTTTDLAAAVRAIAPEGVAVVYDGVGAATFDASLASLRPRGMLALFGAASGAVPPFDLQRLNSSGSLFVTRPTLAHYIADPVELAWRAGEVFAALASGQVQMEIAGRYSLDQAGSAYSALEGRTTTGKLIFVP